MWLFMGLMVLLSPVSYYILGKIMVKKPQNDYFGYRTSRAMQSEESRAFAQKYSARLMIRYGKVSFFLSLLAYLPSFQMSEAGFALYGVVLVIVQSFIAFFIMYQTEKALKARFNEE